MQLVRLNASSFEDMCSQWREAFDGDEDLLFEHCRPHIDHAQRIVQESPPDPLYGIFALVTRTDAGLVYEGFTHVNYAKPRREVRMVWNSLSPKYEAEFASSDLAEFTYAYIAGAIALANSDMDADAVRIYLHNATDRRYAQGIVASMKHGILPLKGVTPTVDMAGNWLHIGAVKGLTL